MARKLDDALLSRIIELRKAGQTVAAIAEATGVSYSAVWRVCVDAGLANRAKAAEATGESDGDDADGSQGPTASETGNELPQPTPATVPPASDPDGWYCETCTHFPVCRFVLDAKQHRAWAICRHRMVRTA